ncbi:glutamate-cysteine ligase family protein [Actinoplanes sp. DH11]|uniref:carboxylate-amine ligase n=1 Tax=Actinoplanes sp. DH11 TaxID=2857011 RepID=UPI001E2B7265|nr:glutamate-cysteine ligase family protein [Actinoplanes sp. DH11]
MTSTFARRRILSPSSQSFAPAAGPAASAPPDASASPAVPTQPAVSARSVVSAQPVVWAQPVVSARPAVEVFEQFLLLDPRSGADVAIAEQVRAALPDGLRDRSRAHGSVLELSAADGRDLRTLRAQLATRRRAAADAAERSGVWLTAIGAPPAGSPSRSGTHATPSRSGTHATPSRSGTHATPSGSDTDGMPLAGRRLPGDARDAAVDPALCGMRVRIGLPDRVPAGAVGERLRIWLPVLQALTANSPFHRGADTGHSSWRAVLRRDRPLPATHPALVVDVADVCTDLDDAILVTALIRAAVATAVTDLHEDRPAPSVPGDVFASAAARAARDGLRADLVDPLRCRVRPAWDVVDEFFATVSPALLDSGDLGAVVDGLARLRDTGDGATRQRRIHRGTGDLRAVVAALAAWTRTGA